MLLLEATVMDATHLELSRPIMIGKGRNVLVSVAESAERDGDRRQWVDAGTAGLQAAYGDAEPDYTPAMVRESNPGYGT